jgi:4a-hydroxytetrahydrobiopterin dehydratase
LRPAALLPAAEVRARLEKQPGWSLSADGKSITRVFELAGFAAAAALIGQIAPAADGLNHHPDLHLTKYRRLEIVLTTHSVGGVTENDFMLAAKIDAMPKQLKA